MLGGNPTGGRLMPAREESDNPAAASALATAIPTAVLCAQALLACAIDDAGHEFAHALVTVLTPGVTLLRIASVGTSSDSVTPAIALAGPLYNLLLGGCALMLARLRMIPPAWRVLLWLVGVLDLLNGFAYPVLSALTGGGDWAKVFAVVASPWLWRLPLGVLGAVGYWATLPLAAAVLDGICRDTKVSQRDARRLCRWGWGAASTLLSVAALFNPYAASLILGSGLAFFLANAGLLAIPSMLGSDDAGMASIGHAPGRAWVVAGGVVALAFVLVLGPGIAVG